jgi:hypothetical protein
VPHLLRHGTSVFKVISERPVILSSECRALGKGAVTTYFKRLRFDATGVTKISDSRRILTPGSFCYVEMLSPPPVNIRRRKLTPISVEFMAVRSIFLRVDGRKTTP